MQVVLNRGMLLRDVSAVILLYFCLSSAAFASSETEYHLKAAFTFKFLKFTYFPEERTARSLKLCLTSEADVFSYFKSIENNRTDGIVITVHKLESDTFDGCDAVFLPANSREASRVGALKQLPVLTIGESDSFLEQGGIIRLFLEDGKMRFRINRKNAEVNGISFSSKLLRLADALGE